MNTVISLDAMGGDVGPSVVVPAALRVLEKHANLKLILVGDQEILRQELKKQNAAESDVLVVMHASQQVFMDESPALALRKKKDSSMRIAINCVKEGQAQACVSAGNTGALMATARFVLKMLPGVDRPAIISSFPTHVRRKNMYMLDLGANVDSTPENLLQFAMMGSVVANAVKGVEHPKVALLNIGKEAIKGNELVKRAGELLAASPVINYIGYIEGDAIYKGLADVIVCDGFVGNVALKTTEGVAKLIIFLIKRGFNKNILTRFVGLMATPILKSIVKTIDPARYNGATFLGLRGLVLKSHGRANVPAFAFAIEQAIAEVEHNVIEKISLQIGRLLETGNEILEDQ